MEHALALNGEGGGRFLHDIPPSRLAVRPMLLRPLVVPLFLAACAAPGAERPPSDAPPAAQAPGLRADDRAARARAAGLDAAEAAALAALDAPAIVPALPGGWRLVGLDTTTVAEAGFTYPAYTLAYRHTDGACATLEAASEGLGDVFVIAPPRERALAPPAGIATLGAVPLGWSETGDAAADWPDGRLTTEWFGADGTYLRLWSAAEDGCAMLGPDEAAALVASLRYLDPADDAAPGAYLPLDLPFDPDAPPATDPEVAARRDFPLDEGEQTAEVLRRTSRRAVVLLTRTNLMDDAVRDERLRAVYFRNPDGTWFLGLAGRQTRCQPGRGHTDWRGALCT